MGVSVLQSRARARAVSGLTWGWIKVDSVASGSSQHSGGMRRIRAC